MADYEDSSEQPVGALSGPQVKMASPKSGGMSVQGKIALDPTETESILANMQKIIDERNSPMNQWLESMKDAAAWTGGGTEGPTRTLATRDVQRQARQKEIFDMQQQMAAYRAAQKDADAFRKEQSSDYTGMPGAQPQGQGASPSETAALAAQIPGAQSQGGKIYYKGVEIPLAIAIAMRGARNREDKDKIFNLFASDKAKSDMKFDTDVGALGNTIEEAIDGRVYNMDAHTKRDIRNFAMKNNMSFKDAARIYLGITGTDKSAEPTTAVQKQAAASDIPKASGGIRFGAIEQVESGGNPNAVSPKGAMGKMQVMPKTAKDPGFGVKPAQNDSPEELARVGRDYFTALQKHYGDDAVALAAYNHGTGNIDQWLKKGAKWKDLPGETRDYISKVYLENAKQARLEGTKTGLTVAPAETSVNADAPARVQQVGARTQEPTLAEIKAEMAATTAGRTKEFEGTGADLTRQQKILIEDGKEAPSLLATTQFLNNLVTSRPKLFGVLQDPGVSSAILSIVEKGLQSPIGGISAPGIPDAVILAIPGVDKSDVAAYKMAASKFAELQLKAAKIMRGDGQITEGERGILRDWIGSERNSPEAIKAMLSWGKVRAEFDKEAYDLYKGWRKANPNASQEQFQLSDKYEDAAVRYTQKLNGLAQTLVPPPKNQTAQAGKPATSGVAPGNLKWSIVKKPGSN